jgi:prolyl-tRNA editing enzyme YbaK/EbsC (Cys-tRNA(Pro) deacylase)
LIRDFDNPGSWLACFELERPVVSCGEAAAAKGVALERELKSLLLTCDDGHVLVHLRGNRELSLRAVKRALASRQARLAERAELEALGLSPGTIHPFHSTLWAMPQLLTRAVLALPWVSTNAGRLDAYVVFDPFLLLRARNVAVGEFEEPGSSP